MSKEITLGKRLKELRELSGLTLRQVEDSIQVSNAYLSQLENDKIKKPSASVLYKLATLYGVDITDLLNAAGLITERPNQKLLTINANQVTREEEIALLEYLKYIRFKNKRK